MDTEISRSPSAYDYPLLVKNLLLAPLAVNLNQEIVYKGTHRFNYATFRERVARLASALLNLGVQKGDTVAVMDWDSHRYLECYFAIPMIGAVLHTINIRLSPEQMVFTINHAEDSVILVNADFIPVVEAIRGRIDTVEKYILMNDDGPTSERLFNFEGEYEALLALAEPLSEFPDFEETARATTFYTTGTTGLPKAVFFSHRQLVLHTLSTCATLASIASRGRFHTEDVYMPITPMFHVHAWGIPYIATFMGVKQVYPGKYNPPALNQLIAEEGVTFSHCVPTILAMLLKDPSSASTDYSAWKVIIGGAALPKALCAQAMERGIEIFTGYGMSETCPIIGLTSLSTAECALPREEQIALRVRTGKPIGLVHMKVLGSDGAEVPSDDHTTGELVVRAPWLTQGYLKDRSNSEKLWTGGWLHTQDVSVRNLAGSVRITDRLKDVIKVGGEWLSSLELEDIIASHPAVAEVAVVGSHDEKWGEIPLALIVLKAGGEISEHRLMEHVKSYIDRGLLPREAILLKVKVIEALEKTSVGKTNKLALREKHAHTE